MTRKALRGVFMACLLLAAAACSSGSDRSTQAPSNIQRPESEARTADVGAGVKVAAPGFEGTI